MDLEKINEIMEQKNISAPKLAKLTGIQLRMIYRIIDGTTPNPSIKTVVKIAKALGTGVDEIVLGDV